MKNIGIITGASSGMGEYFAETAKSNIDSLDELWLIARTEERLKKVSEKCGIKTEIIPLDLSLDNSFEVIKEKLNDKDINVKLLVNASGYGKFESTMNISTEDNLGMVDLNVKALTHMCLVCLPHMSNGSSIINFGSVASFQPVPYINVYAATKAYVLSFSRSLNQELKHKGIKVMTICPYWTKTRFFDRAATDNKVIKKYVAMYETKDNVNRAWRDLKRGKDVSQYGFIARSQVILCKILPHKLVMKIWLHQQGLDKK